MPVMARTLTAEIFDGPFTQPLREADRFQGAIGTVVTPTRMANGNLPDQPANLPVKPLGPDGPLPFKNLRSGREG